MTSTHMSREQRRRILDGLEGEVPSEPWIDTRKVSRFQSVAELRTALETMPVILHDEGPVEDWGTTTYLDIDLERGTVRLSSDHDDESYRTRNDAGITRCYEVCAGTPGHCLAKMLVIAEAEMPAIMAGFDSDDYGMCGGLTTDESYEALLRVRDALGKLNEEMEAA